MKRILPFILIAIAFASCSKLYDPNIHRDKLIGLSIGKDTLKLVVGQKIQVPITTNPASYAMDSLRWMSSDSTVVSVSNTGLLTAKKVGSASIIVTNLEGSLSVSKAVLVRPSTADSLKAGLIAYWAFSGSAVDSSGNGNTGTVYGATLTTDRNGNANSAYYFDGISSYITVNDNPALRLNNADFTLNMWVDLAGYIDASGSALLAKNQGAGQKGWNCSITGLGNQDGATTGSLFYNVSGGTDPFASGNIVDSNKWYMLTITYQVSKKKISMYINSVFDAQVLNIPTPNADSDGKLHIGDNSYLDVPGAIAPYYFFKGKMDDIRIYNRVLSVSEINKLYTIPN